MSTNTQDINESLLASLLADENFVPTRPASIEETGLGEEFVEQLICKYLAVFGTSKGRAIADHLCLPFNIVEPLLQHAADQPARGPRRRGALQRLLLQPHRPGPQRGPMSYLRGLRLRRPGAGAADATTSSPSRPSRSPPRAPARKSSPRRSATSPSIPSLFESLGPAINSGAGMFLYGAPGNGKSTLAKRITICFGQEIWIPHALYEDGQIIKLYDSAYHTPVVNDERGITKCGEHDRRWMQDLAAHGGRRRRTDDGQPRTPPRSAEQRQRSAAANEEQLRLPADRRLRPAAHRARPTAQPLDRAAGNAARLPHAGRPARRSRCRSSSWSSSRRTWSRATWSTRRFCGGFPYKIEIGDPSEEEFHDLFQLVRQDVRLRVPPRRGRRPPGRGTTGRPDRRLRRCQPRDLLLQIRSYCNYTGQPMELRPEYFDRVVKSYFATVLGDEA